VAKGFISGLVWGVLVSGVAGAGASVYNSGSYKGLIAPEMVANKPEAVEPEGGLDMAKPDVASLDVAPLTEPAKVEKPTKAEEQNPEPVQPEAVTSEPAPTPAIDDGATESEDETQDQTGASQSQEAQKTADAPEDDAPKDDAPETEKTDEAQDVAIVDKEEDQLAMQTDAQNQTPPVTPSTPEPQKEAEAETSKVEAETSESEQDQAAEKPAESLMVPVLGISNMAPNVETGRLPSIGGNETATDTATESQPVKSQGALLDFAADFDNPNQLPVMSIVLIEDPKTPVPDKILKNLPFPISFAIDAARDDALAASQRYRQAGFEVMMLTNLPFGAQASDIEVAYQAYSRAIPEAIGVLDLGGNGFLRGPSTAKQVADILADSGAALLTPSKGLNTAQKTALKAGVPAGLIFRELDKDGEKSAVIRRYLDRATFEAKQEGYAIMLGHTRPQTIEALVQWALEDRAASVAIGPVSAALKGM